MRIAAADVESRSTAGESIWTESSYKYEPDSVIEMAADAGFATSDQWIDDAAGFALTLLRLMLAVDELAASDLAGFEPAARGHQIASVFAAERAVPSLLDPFGFELQRAARDRCGVVEVLDPLRCRRLR